MSEFTISVRDLAAFCYRSGDIDYRFIASPTAEQGMEGHRQVYSNRPETYQREYSVSFTRQQEGISLRVRGRADGYDPGATVELVEEIKTCRIPVASIPDAVTRLHLAQARIYAAIIAAERGLEQLEVRLTWFNIDTSEEYQLSQHYSQGELQTFLEETLARFSLWLSRLAGLREVRDASLIALEFPHGEFRRGQRDIAELVYKCIDQGGELMVEAPTGTGKTAAVLYPALKAQALGKHEGIVYVTARTVGRVAAEECLSLFTDAGMRTSALSLTAKDKVCFSPGRACHGDDCPYARGYYDRLPAALDAALSSPSLRRSDVESVAREFEVCPYHLADDLLPWIDIVIADQHYLYSLYAKLGNRMHHDARRWTVLLDEAHNLPDRARGMYSAQLGKDLLMKVKKSEAGPVARALQRINRAMLALQRTPWQEDNFHSSEQLPRELVNALGDFIAATGVKMAEQADFLQQRPQLMDFYFGVLQWLRVAQCWDQDFRFELSRGSGRHSLVLSLNCLDPSRLLAQRQQPMHALVAFSATLSPAPWMQAMLGLVESVVCRRMASPFTADQLSVEVAVEVDTRYQQRAASMDALAARIEAWLEGNPGNCIVYFPSYTYLQACLSTLVQRPLGVGDRALWQQTTQQDESARSALLQQFEQHRNTVAFCILGGVFGEGIDLPGERLASVVVVGVGLPQFNREREQLRGWFQRRYGAGFEYAYLYPGMQKVDQALGRVVRTPQDRGTALLIDGRYARDEYRKLLPCAWSYHS